MLAERRERMFQLLVVKARNGDTINYDLDLYIATSRSKMEEADVAYIEKLVAEFIAEKR